jgi:hypothetical protein
METQVENNTSVSNSIITSSNSTTTHGTKRKKNNAADGSNNTTNNTNTITTNNTSFQTPAAKRIRTETYNDELYPNQHETNTAHVMDSVNSGLPSTTLMPMYSVFDETRIKHEHEFFLFWHNTTSFKKLINLISPVLTTISFNVLDKISKKGNRFRGISVNSMDESHISMIIARLQANELYFGGSMTSRHFCVDADVFAFLVNNLPDNNHLELKQLKGSAEICLRSFSVHDRTNEIKHSIPTIDKAEDSNRLDIIGYQFVVDINLHTFRNIIKTAMHAKFRVDNIHFQIYETVDEKNQLKFSKLIIALETETCTSSQYIYRSLTQWKKEDRTQTAITTHNESKDGDHMSDRDMVLVFDEKFATKYLNFFVKCMDKCAKEMKVCDIYSSRSDDLAPENQNKIQWGVSMTRRMVCDEVYDAVFELGLETDPTVLQTVKQKRCHIGCGWTFLTEELIRKPVYLCIMKPILNSSNSNNTSCRTINTTRSTTKQSRSKKHAPLPSDTPSPITGRKRRRPRQNSRVVQQEGQTDSNTRVLRKNKKKKSRHVEDENHVDDDISPPTSLPPPPIIASTSSPLPSQSSLAAQFTPSPLAPMSAQSQFSPFSNDSF